MKRSELIKRDLQDIENITIAIKKNITDMDLQDAMDNTESLASIVEGLYRKIAAFDNHEDESEVYG